MHNLNMKTSKFYLYNGYMMTAAFLICRMFPIMPLWFQFYSLIGTKKWNQINLIYKCVCIFTSVPLDVLNIYWFGKLVKGCLKHRNQVTRPHTE